MFEDFTKLNFWFNPGSKIYFSAQHFQNGRTDLKALMSLPN